VESKRAVKDRHFMGSAIRGQNERGDFSFERAENEARKDVEAGREPGATFIFQRNRIEVDLYNRQHLRSSQAPGLEGPTSQATHLVIGRVVAAKCGVGRKPPAMFAIGTRSGRGQVNESPSAQKEASELGKYSLC
jgi:hypothetical protein